MHVTALLQELIKPATTISLRYLAGKRFFHLRNKLCTQSEPRVDPSQFTRIALQHPVVDLHKRLFDAPPQFHSDQVCSTSDRQTERPYTVMACVDFSNRKQTFAKINDSECLLDSHYRQLFHRIDASVILVPAESVISMRVDNSAV